MAIIEIDDKNIESTINAGGIVLVDCWAPWCRPCRAFKPVFEAAAEKHEDAVFATLDTEANQGLGAALQIQSIPTLMIFRDRIQIYRQPGALSAKALDDLIDQVKALDMDEVRASVEAQAEKDGES